VPTDELTGFAIAGEDKKWFWADAKIVDDKVVLSSKDVERPCPFGKLA
jgi:sialate O-acetylesterase